MCFYVRLSGDAHGFHDMMFGDASQAAKELGAIKESAIYTKNFLGARHFSTSFFNSEDKEVFIWHRDIQAGQVFDPPREVAPYFLSDRTV